ncbi:M10 family metallopeptidase C-terminal domain-containing protein [Mesorhizobium sp. A556]
MRLHLRLLVSEFLNRYFWLGIEFYFSMAGADAIIVFTSVGSELTINAGAGADIIVLDPVLNVGSANLVYTAQSDSTYVNFDTIAGFMSGSDTIDLSAFKLTGETGTVAAGNTSVTTIAQLAGGVADFFRVGGETLAVATFHDGADTYVLADLDNDGNFNTANDLVIDLLGAVFPITAADFVFA